MDASQVVAHINWLAVAVAAVAGLPLGALWYGPLFGSAWIAAPGITKVRARQANRVKIYVAAAFGITCLFEFRSLKLWAINAGYQVVVFSVMGAILGVRH
jgi:hypothetical protein